MTMNIQKHHTYQRHRQMKHHDEEIQDNILESKNVTSEEDDGIIVTSDQNN